MTATMPDKYRPDLNEIEGEFDLAGGDRDPFVGECPKWCGGVHHAVTDEDDRYHYGKAFFLPLRSLGGHFYKQPDGEHRIAINDMWMSIEQPALHRDPRIRLGAPDRADLFLTVDEAEQVIHALAALIKETM